MKEYIAGIDIGGTRVKLGVIDRQGRVLASDVYPTEKHSEQAFLDQMAARLDSVLKAAGIAKEQLAGAGVSIGSFVFAPGGEIDGMSEFVPFFVSGYPLREKLEQALGLACRVDNDARLICMAEAVYGAGRDFDRVLTLTLGTGVGVGLCADGKATEAQAVMHLAGHILVRGQNEAPWLDEPPCYCGQTGCLESTCSGTSLQKYVQHELGPDATCESMFRAAAEGDEKALACAHWYVDMLAKGLNQYVYVYCPDVIVLGGGVAKSLGPWLPVLEQKLCAQVHSRQHTQLRLAQLEENAGVLGAAAQFL